MISLTLHLVLLLLLTSLQVSTAIWLNYITPELVFAVILALSLAGDHIHTVWWIAVGGLVLDLVIGGVVGVHLLLFSLFGLILYHLSFRWLRHPAPPVALLIFSLASLSFEVLLNLQHRQISWYILLPSIGTAVIATLIYYLIIYFGKQREVIRVA